MSSASSSSTESVGVFLRIDTGWLLDFIRLFFRLYALFLWFLNGHSKEFQKLRGH
jgi:hypothetical protein